MKNILFAASEAVPFIKTGGLADVIGSLPFYVDKEAYDVRVILPKYECMEESLKGNLEFVGSTKVQLGWRKQDAGVYTITYQGIRFYFIENTYYFSGDRPYHVIYEDVEKFSFFSKAVLEVLPLIEFRPHIIHCHDWQTGLLPVFLKTQYGAQKYYQSIKTIFTIHNLKFQGRWKLDEVRDVTGLSRGMFQPSTLESYGEANLLKGGLVFSDAITTVSPCYSEEIMTQEGGEGLDGVLRERKEHVYGIVNGLDYNAYNPATDPYIVKTYTKRTVQKGKQANKAYLQRLRGLKEDENCFTIAMISRMTSQKGFELVGQAMDVICSWDNIQVITLGTGEERFENMFRHYQWKYPEKVSSVIGFTEKEAHEIYAGADAFLMPSLFEPCGLSQLMSLRYGTVPMVRATGGLKDTVFPFNELTQKGWGFNFWNYNVREMLHMIQYAKDIFENEPELFRKIQKSGMNQDFSWSHSAKEYENIYEHL